MKQLLRDLELAQVQDAALAQRISDLQLQARENVMDKGHLTRLEKQVAAFGKEKDKAAKAAGSIQEQVTRQGLCVCVCSSSSP